MRNIGKLVSLALLVAVTPLLSTCDKAEPTPPKSHVSPAYGSPNEAWSRLLRALWPTLYVRADPVPVPKPTPGPDTDGLKGPGEVEPKPSIHRPRAEQHSASTRHRRDAESHKAGHTQHRKACECRIGRRGRTAVLDVQHSRAGAAQVAQIADRGISVPTRNPKRLTAVSASAQRATAQIPEAGTAHPSAEWIAWRPNQNPNELVASRRSI